MRKTGVSPHEAESEPEPRRLRVLHLEDSEPDHELALAYLRRAGLDCAALRVETEATFRAALEQPWAVILSDFNLPGFSGLRALEIVREQGLQIPFILVSGEIGEDVAVQAMRDGASDYLLKANLKRLAPATEHAIAAQESRRARQRADEDLAASRKRLSELAQHLQTSIEMERTAIAREIHDDVGGSLSALKFDLAWIARQANTSAEAKARLEVAMDSLNHALEASQRIMHNLRPAILDHGLVPALQWMAQRFERRTGVTCSFRASHDNPELPAGLPLVAYRTAQEALTNISKHARASRVAIDFSLAQGVLSLEISDNGCGLSEQDLGKARSFGIRGLHERASTVGGWVELSSTASGTTLILSIPLEACKGASPEGEAESSESHDPSAWGDL